MTGESSGADLGSIYQGQPLGGYDFDDDCEYSPLGEIGTCNGELLDGFVTEDPSVTEELAQLRETVAHLEELVYELRTRNNSLGNSTFTQGDVKFYTNSSWTPYSSISMNYAGSNTCSVNIPTSNSGTRSFIVDSGSKRAKYIGIGQEVQSIEYSDKDGGFSVTYHVQRMGGGLALYPGTVSRSTDFVALRDGAQFCMERLSQAGFR